MIYHVELFDQDGGDPDYPPHGDYFVESDLSADEVKRQLKEEFDKTYLEYEIDVTPVSPKSIDEMKAYIAEEWPCDEEEDEEE